MQTKHHKETSCIVSEEKAGTRLDVFLSDFLQISRARVQDIMSSNDVTLDGKKCTKCSVKVKIGQVYNVSIREPEEIQLIPKEIDLDILFEDEHILVLNKPSGLVVHPAPGHYDDTLVNALLSHCKESLSGIGGKIRPGIVHRLDKDTSGLMVVAKHDKSHGALALQFAHDNKTIIREYIAIVYGILKQSKGCIDEPISRHKTHRQKMAVNSSGKPSITLYEIEKTFKNTSKLKCTLKTGRTHQIRVHLSHIGFPIIGDQLYVKNIQKSHIKDFKRQALHAFRLSFFHPISRQFMSFESNLPKDMCDLLNTLENEG